MIETLLGGVFGGALRLVPEVLKFLDRGNDRKHELAMLARHIELDKMRGEQALALARVEADQARETFDGEAFLAAIKSQFQPSGVPWVDAMSAFIRPFLTIYWCVGLYSVALLAQFVLLKERLETAGNDAAVWAAVVGLWGPDEKAIVGSMFAFWFADRALRSRWAKR